MTVRIRGPWKFNVCALAFVPILILAVATRTDAQTKAYVTHSGANLVTVIDTKSGTVIGTIPVGANPTGATMSPDGNHLYVTNQDAGTLSVIDTNTDTT